MSFEPTTCTFEHPAFGTLVDPVFRITDGDQVPVLSIRLDGATAVVPLASLPRLFCFDADSSDARMLNIVGSALRFVVSLRPGDKLPTEVLSGKASWQPSPFHRQSAFARLQLQLLEWLRTSGTAGAAATPITAAMLVANDPATKSVVQEAMRRAASELGVEGGGPAVAALLEELSEEIAYIEALRERLLDRITVLHDRLAVLARARLPSARRETLTQVVRLMGKGLVEITARFAEADACTADIFLALRDLEERRSLLRPARDWLYCTQLAWEPELRNWDAAPGKEVDDAVWRLVGRLYRFVAPRYMEVQEWQKADKAMREDQAKATYVW